MAGYCITCCGSSHKRGKQPEIAIVMMTNGDNGLALMNQVADRVVAAYEWDSLEKPLPR